jgi:predicted amidohydrolase YtcJ
MVATRDELIKMATPFTASITRLPKARQTLQVDRITAGFVDAHAHPLGLGIKLGAVDLDLGSYDEVLGAIEAWGRNIPADEWVTGRGWDQNNWADAPAGSWPLAAHLDERLPGRKVAVRRIDGHATWVSSAGLAAFGIDRDTTDPAGGQIIRDAAGNPTGVLIDTAAGLIDLPAPGHTERTRLVLAALDEMAAHGLTGAHDMGVSDATLAVYDELDRTGKLPLRIWAYLDPSSRAAGKLLRNGPYQIDRLRVVGIKAYADGALGSRGAHLSAPYADRPDHTGLEITSPEALRSLAASCVAAQASLAVHAIGDAAVTDVLDAFEHARGAHPEAVLVPLRVEHAQVVRPEDRRRFVQLNAIASMQPTHATSDSPWAEERLGPERISWAYSWRTLRNARAELAFGSDFPVEDVDPSEGIWAGTTRGGWTTDEVLTLEETITAFTLGAAYAVGEEARLGVVDNGLHADLTLWRQDDDRLRAVGTIVGGKVVWLDPSLTEDEK